MKKVLNAIKKGFLGVIGWIKNTAWVQPLLIVGAIFGLIMSIKEKASRVQFIAPKNNQTHCSFFSNIKTFML